MRTGMFAHGHSAAEVEQALNEHYERDSKAVKVLDFVTLACVVYLVRDMSKLDAAAVIVGLIAGVSAMRHFIDQSNRNFYLHRLEWDRATARERQETPEEREAREGTAGYGFLNR